MNNIWLQADTDYLGEMSGTGDVTNEGEVRYYHPPAKWENGYKGPRFAEYPLADEYAINKGKVALDAINHGLRHHKSHAKNSPNECPTNGETRMGKETRHYKGG
eukprot:scaffold35524_cov28-Tisochrysis_lutea.AAC.1